MPEWVGVRNAVCAVSGSRCTGGGGVMEGVQGWVLE